MPNPNCARYTVSPELSVYSVVRIEFAISVYFVKLQSPPETLHPKLVDITLLDESLKLSLLAEASVGRLAMRQSSSLGHELL